MSRKESFEYDAFISHAVEDKLPIANELCARLEQAGLKIWYSGRELRVGDRLTQTIEEGLLKSRFGIVILSPTYVSKMWTLREFYSLLSREKEGRKVILPVLYDITPEQLAQKDLTMAEMFSLRADRGMDQVIKTLMCEIDALKKEDKRKKTMRILAGVKSILSSLSIFYIIGLLFMKYARTDSGVFPYGDGVEMKRVVNDFAHPARVSQGAQYSTKVTVNEFSDGADTDHVKGYIRTEYKLVATNGEIKYQKNVEGTFEVAMDTSVVFDVHSFCRNLLIFPENFLTKGPRCSHSQEETETPGLTLKRENDLRTVGGSVERPSKEYSTSLAADSHGENQDAIALLPGQSYFSVNDDVIRNVPAPPQAN